jgi:primosomal protein N' (replication factor Y) (superfamily II helicase)
VKPHMQYAEVAVRSEAPYRHPFTYAVPSDLALAPGQGVLVPFGSRTLQGVVLSLSPEPSFDGEVRQLLRVADELPLLPTHLLELARWMADRYVAPLFSCVALLLPPGVARRARVRFVALHPASATKTNAREGAILGALAGVLHADKTSLERATGLKRIGATLDSMARRGLIAREYSLTTPTGGPRLLRSLRLIGNAASVDVAGPLYRRLALSGGAFPFAELERLPEWSKAEVRHLIDSGLAEEAVVQVVRDPLAGKTFPPSDVPILTPAQSGAVDAIAGASAGAPPFLLHGVTGSGKTEVYLAATASTLALGRQALILVPEISLTPQTVERFAGRFPGRVAILHSALTDGQRYDQWSAIRDGHVDVVVGSRSALLAPLTKLGLIVIDEAHEWTYKQTERQPRYQTRDVAARLSQLTGATLVMGSATPDVTSYARADRRRYTLLRLPDRVVPSARSGTSTLSAPAAGSLPAIETVDLRRELREGNVSIFSRALSSALAEALERQEQAILFLNRRGSAQFLLCRDCGHVPRCARCSLSLTYHADGQRLVCHQCGRSRGVPDRCPGCRGRHLRRLGAGTQRVVEEVERRFPSARILRWDADNARTASDHDRLYGAMLHGDADVLVGTQMVAKGLDLPGVTLVGVVNADLALNIPEYYSAERAFQLLTQVAGRAGRRDRPGRVILQTYTPEHYALQAVAKHDYQLFFEREMAFRKRAAYPPYSRLTRLVYATGGAEQAEVGARQLATSLRSLLAEGNAGSGEVVGPVPCRLPRLRGRWRWQILLRSPQPSALLNCIDLPDGLSVDVDPQSFV